MKQKQPESPASDSGRPRRGCAQNAKKSTDQSRSGQDPRRFLLAAGRDLREPIRTCPSASTCEAWSQELQCSVIVFNRCRRWGCAYCGPLKVRSLAAKTAEAKPTSLITLTVDPKLHTTPRAAYEMTTPQVSRFAARVRKQFKPFEYMRVLEVTKKGWPHYHLVARCPFIPQARLSTIWAELTGAPIVDVRKIRESWHVYTYVVKYLAKQTYIPWTDRRVSHTRDFFSKDNDWQPTSLGLVGHTFNSTHPLDYVQQLYQGFTLEHVEGDVWKLADGPSYADRWGIPETPF